MAMSINSGAIAIKKIQASADSDLVKAIQDGEIAIRKKRNDTECGCLRTATSREEIKDFNRLAPLPRCVESVQMWKNTASYSA